MDDDITRLLNASQHGDADATAKLIDLIYAELRRIAAIHLHRENHRSGMEPTDLVHELYTSFFQSGPAQGWESRHHFYRYAAKAMLHWLVDESRRRLAAKRGGILNRVQLTDNIAINTIHPDDIIALDEALTTLQREEPELALIFEQRVVLSRPVSEIIKELGLPERTFHNRLQYAKARLRCLMDGEPDSNG